MEKEGRGEIGETRRLVDTGAGTMSVHAMHAEAMNARQKITEARPRRLVEAAGAELIPGDVAHHQHSPSVIERRVLPGSPEGKDSRNPLIRQRLERAQIVVNASQVLARVW